MYFFTVVMDELTNTIQDGVPWCKLFADNIVLIDENKGVTQMLEQWRNILGRGKTECMHRKFSQYKKSEIEVKLDGIIVPTCNNLDI